MKDDYRDIYFCIMVFLFAFVVIILTGIYIETIA